MRCLSNNGRDQGGKGVGMKRKEAENHCPSGRCRCLDRERPIMKTRPKRAWLKDNEEAGAAVPSVRLDRAHYDA